MLTLKSIYKSFESDFNSIINDARKKNFGIDTKESSTWVDYQDSDMYVLDNEASWIEETIYDYCLDISKKKCSEVIDAIVNTFGIDDTLDMFYDEYGYEFKNIAELKKFDNIEYAVAQILFDIFLNPNAYESENGTCVVDYFINLYANAVGEYFNFF